MPRPPPHPLLLATTLIALSNIAKAAVCGDRGSHDFSKQSFYMGNFFFGAPSTFSLCADFCKKDAPRCKSFRYSYYSDANSQYCEYFENYMTRMESQTRKREQVATVMQIPRLTTTSNEPSTWFTPQSDEPYYYFDMDCIGFPEYNTPSANAASTTTTSTAISRITVTTTYTQNNVTPSTVTRTETVTSVQQVQDCYVDGEGYDDEIVDQDYNETGH
ncbi:hypothetical protein CC78DRAFT_608422 [Lojkania enalia]|uniref:Apple domain-containing protein n=1 Tax=Lojkania enalia TaxID=147567 RepID=A0A9P4N716_9PLEO|nr:hypothetical protein CC78DRAFT_608422 [Didymosphaeria enalia]